MTETTRENTIFLFDIDGTLTLPRKKADKEMLEFLEKLRKTATIATVGGSDFVKAKEQMGDDILDRFDYVFAENGLTAYQDGKLFSSTSLKTELGEENIKKFVNFVLHYIADLDIPIKRGTFIEFRTGMINVSPIGRNCSQEERDAFEEYDKEHQIRSKMLTTLKAEFKDMNLEMSVGGQISFDVFPQGWDKSFALRHIHDRGFKHIHFFGDKTYKGGNDYEIFVHPDVIGHSTTGPTDTIQQISKLLGF
eukprot:c8314_g1_i2.p1 GENE.c8314_g1_i2~~c8314_g1_i2.p1  ORF type:complete len:258 (-),score=71.50 c8314_g1_i2:700-1449(-)